MVRWLRWHCPPDTWFEIRALAVWGRARYLSVTETPHNTNFHTWMGKKQFCFFQTAETGNRTPDSGVKGSGANHYPRAPALIRCNYYILYSSCVFQLLWDVMFKTLCHDWGTHNIYNNYGNQIYILLLIVSKHILEKQVIGNMIKRYSACSASPMWENRGKISARISEGEEQIGCYLMASTFTRCQIPSRCHEPNSSILTLSARGPYLDVWIWRLLTSNFDA